MTKHVKITLSGSQDIPFGQLVLSQANVRRVKAGVSIDTLAEDIARRGLLQSLTVRAELGAEGEPTGRFEVPAGGRRYRALQMLVKARRMAKTEPVPCVVRDDDTISAEEDSLAENLHREALHPLDQFRAMQALVEQGTNTVETVAATFMVTPAVVRQRLRLAAVSPKLHAVYADDGMTLDQLIAFSVTEDQARQEQAWELLKDGHAEPYVIRRKLTEATVRADDRRALFVTREAYEAEGGYILRDLFDDDQGGWLQDVALLDRLTADKLAEEAARIGEEGWKWVSAVQMLGYRFDAGMRGLVGAQPPLDDAQEAELAKLKEEAEALEAEWSSAEEIPADIEARITTIDEAIGAIVDRPVVYDPDDIARAGAFVSIGYDGSTVVVRGFVRPEDEPEIEGADDSDGAGAAGEDGTASAGADAPADEDGAIPAPGAAAEAEEQDDLLRPLPDRLVTELTGHRTLALRNALATSPLVAFAAVLHALVIDCFYSMASHASCVKIAVRGGHYGIQEPGLRDTPAARSLDARHSSWGERLPDDVASLWEALAGLDADDQAALFAHCAGQAVNAVWEPTGSYNAGRISERDVSGRIAHSHILARATGLDMVAAGWTPTVDNYLGRVTKPRILAAVEEAKGAEVANRLAGFKKDEMADKAAIILEGSGWLPEPLRTPGAPDAETGDDSSGVDVDTGGDTDTDTDTDADIDADVDTGDAATAIDGEPAVDAGAGAREESGEADVGDGEASGEGDPSPGDTAGDDAERTDDEGFAVAAE